MQEYQDYIFMAVLLSFMLFFVVKGSRSFKAQDKAISTQDLAVERQLEAMQDQKESIEMMKESMQMQKEAFELQKNIHATLVEISQKLDK